MRTVILASLRTHTRRYGAALLAVVIGSAFIVVTAALSSAMREGLTAGIAEPYAGADAVVDSPSAAEAGDLLDAAGASGADAWLIGWTMQQVATSGPAGGTTGGTAGGTVIDTDTDIGQLPDRPSRRWQELVQGRFPGGPGEAVVDTNTAKVERIAVGDRLRIGTGGDALDVTVVGLVDSPSTYAYASVYVLWADLARWQDQLFVTSLAWAGPDPTAAIHEVAPDAEVEGVDAYVQELHQQVNSGVDLVRIIVLMFGAIALVVGVLVINNTFTILFAQRTRDFALLRCVGATRSQVLRSVRLESLALGVLAAVIGVLTGLGAGHGLVALVRAQWPQTRLGEAHVTPAWLAGAAVVAIAVTLVAAWLPTRRAVRVSPLAALRPDDSTQVRTRTGRIRLALGVLALGTGALGLVAAIATANVGALAAGGTAVFLGVLLFGPVLVPALIRAAGPLTQRLLGPAGRLAAGNAVRNPRRTAATAASLLVGVTLTTAVLTGMASSRSALSADMDEQHPIDLAVTGTAPLPADLEARLRAVDGIAAAVPVPGAVARIGDLDPLPLLPATADGTAQVLHGDLPTPGPRQVIVPWDLIGDGVEVGDLVPVTVGDTTRELRVAGGEGWGEAALVRRTTLDRLAPGATTRAVWLRAAADADPEDLAGSVEAVASPVDAGVENGLAKRAYVDTQLDVLTGGVVGLLAIAVLIALVGIGNTLGLSVLERGREHALLRALGLTRRQVRRMLAAEAVLLSVVATVLGTALGVLFAWTAVRALVQPAVDGASLVLPWGQLALVVTASALAGLVAAVLPSRKASRITPAAGLSLD
ncbi:ABC transporter permease [Nocardioides nitrophenolicus]|uniref:ABC transporter permease n=1 Tax=Nocardioides nitrophenolicus TaxID=60489 RepID=UPI001959A3CF|nr:FtsX-like permease family protein [Nocardioides nitrophenolicus]MBM7518073.1 putative ABC transport system permease protein [Nocardioides nitrophenolicus]